jgi:cytochrome P450
VSYDVEFDPFSETFFDDPYETYRHLRDHEPVYFCERYGFYALSRYADVIAAHQDNERFVSSYGVTVDGLMEHRRLDTNILIIMDPPEHDRQRKLVSQAFTRRAVEGLEPLVARVIHGYLDQLADRERFDVVADFAALFPVEVISAMLGVPEDDRQQIRHWTDEFLYRRPGNPKATQEGMTASLDMAGYFLDLARQKRAKPDDLIISRLIDATITDDDGTERKLTDEDVASFSVVIAAAGSETVTKLIGNGVVLFDAHRDQWRAIADDPSAIPGAVEEILRYQPPSQYQGRFAVTDVDFDGGTIPAGSPTLLLTGAATRDPRVFDRADEFDISRGGHTTLAFGYGAHSCLGAWLARLESRIAFEEISRRWPDFAVDASGLRRVTMSNVAGYSAVPIEVPRRAA